jgi:hypothetical protein
MGPWIRIRHINSERLRNETARGFLPLFLIIRLVETSRHYGAVRLNGDEPVKWKIFNGAYTDFTEIVTVPHNRRQAQE